MNRAVVCGAVAGAGMGYVLQRGQLCFSSMFATARRGGLLLRGWLLGVALASVGLSVLYATDWSHGLTTGLPFRPVANISGGLIVGVGMAIASSCVSGLFYRLGSGMVGASVGVAGWAMGELAARSIHIPGPTVLPGGFAATVPGVLGVPRLVGAIVFLAVVVVGLRWRPTRERPTQAWQWDWPQLGVALAVVTVGGWVLARLGGSGFGPSTVGAVASIAAGTPNWWLVAFLVAIIGGSAVAAGTAGGWWLRGEQPLRYAQLAVGGFLMGAGGWIGGGCNLGHGLSGVAQMNVSSFVVVVCMALGVRGSRAALLLIRSMLSAAPQSSADRTRRAAS